jgi:DNA-binding transcriptional ArsR family regulator
MTLGSPDGRSKAEEVLSALSDPTRRALLWLLAERGEATATSMAPELSVSRQAVSKHLGVLDEAGLVRARRRGREVRYRVRPEPLHGTATWLHDLAVMWELRLRRIKSISEEVAKPEAAETKAPRHPVE